MNALTKLPSGLPSVANAKLPAVYESARTALAECSRVDECKDWADKAEALASYAKQAGDDSLRKTADRIQARAIQRCGELLKAINPSKGGRPRYHEGKCSACGYDGPLKIHECTKRGPAPDLVSSPTRTDAAREAGLSKRQQRDALRVANVPRDEFEAAVESDDPPTVTALAERGKKAAPLFDLKGRDPRDFKNCTAALGLLRDVHAFAERTDPRSVIRGASAKERERFLSQVPLLLGWFNELLSACQLENK